MDILKVTEQFLKDVHYPDRRQASITEFEHLVVWQIWDAPEMEVITERLLTALQEETDPGVKSAILWVLETGVWYCNQDEVVDWDVIMGQLPLLSEDGLLHALSMLYRHLSLENISVLKRYLDHPSLMVRMNALDVICETIAIAGNRDEDLEVHLRPKPYCQLQMLINSPVRRKQIPAADLEQQFLAMCHEVMSYIELWLKHYNRSSG